MHQEKQPDIQQNKPDRRNKHLNFYLPHEFGGFADPTTVQLQHLNLFSEDVDIPQIKPRTLGSAHEFYIQIPAESLRG